MRSSRDEKNAILSLLLVFVGDVLEAADAFLNLALGLVAEAFRLLLAVAGQRPELLARLAGDVLHVALGLVLVHNSSCTGRKCPPVPEQGACLCRYFRRRLGLAGDPFRRGVVEPRRAGRSLPTSGSCRYEP